MSQTVSLSFFRFGSVRTRLWAFGQMGFARIGLSLSRDIGFWKLCGSGSNWGEGFTPVALPRVFAIVATWPDEETARAGTKDNRVFRAFRRKSDEQWSVFLGTRSARGNWSGKEPFEITQQVAPSSGPVAALTRANIRLRKAGQFWDQAPAVSKRVADDPNVIFKIGIGEMPLFHQVTFSIWPSVDDMAAFARTGAHAEAIRAVRENGWFSEELYARFTVLSDEGTWNGTSPLSRLPEAA